MELLDKKFLRNKNVAWRIIDGEALLVHPSTNIISPLDEICTRIWELIDGKLTGRDIAGIVEKEFTENLSVIETDLNAFLDELLQNNLIILCD
ncbi:MAG: PqqD family protein [Candidatus Omnitrophica bacterium]|nr:PqqD family protein [Candidatus Omnitrophota bacterium]